MAPSKKSRPARPPRRAAKPASPRRSAPRTRAARASTKRTDLAAVEPGRAAPSDAGQTLPVEVQAGRVDEALRNLKETLTHWANTGRYTKVRFKFRGKALLPDLPLAAVVAAEGLTFYWTGILRALLVNVAGRSVLAVELVNDSEKHVQAGKDALLDGDVDRAVAEFGIALAKQRDNAAAHLNLGVARKLQGDRVGARASLERARSLDPEGAVGKDAERLLQGLAD